MDKRIDKKIKKQIKYLESVENLTSKELENTQDFKNFNNEYDRLEKSKRIDNQNKMINILIILIVLFTISISIWWGLKFIYFSENFVDDIIVNTSNNDKEKAVLNIKIKNKKIYENAYCGVGVDKSNITWVKINNNICTTTIDKNEIKNIYIKTKKYKIKPYEIDDIVIEAKIEKEDTIYLSLNNSEIIKDKIETIGKTPKIEYKIENESIAEIKNNRIISKKEGKTKLALYINDDKYDEINIVVTSLITKMPKNFDKNKKHLKCNKYSSKDNKILDEILYSRINEAGYKTRAGVVAAARFLTLEFPYQIEYFYENGRLNESGKHFADGEGRYYHRGLYLNKDKIKDIKYTFAGPAIWGCPLMNYEDEGRYVSGTKMPNGLDCSGFVTWVLLNGGFDVGDYGAGETPEPNQMTDLGKRMTLTKELVNSNTIKVGDLLNWWGHIAIIIGIDSNTYYVAESLDTYGGVAIQEYKKSELHDDWSFVMLMDKVYKKDGKLTNMWY